MSGDPWEAVAAPGTLTPAPTATPRPARSARPASDPWAAVAAPGTLHKPADSPSASLVPTGEAHDGDTLTLTNGQRGRLLGVDAFELNQTGRAPDGSIVPLGQQARDRALPFYQPGANVTAAGGSTYGRPVVTVENGGDPGAALLHDGLAVAEPQYLRGDPQRMMDYVQEDRLARLNRRGAHADTFQTPSSFRHGGANPVTDPAGARQEGGTDAIFWDDPTPAAGLSPKVANGYVAIWQDMRSTPADLLAYAKENGFQLNPKDVEARYAARAKTKSPGSDISYQTAPRVLTDMKDGAFGASLRGFADPFNVLDETGAVVDSLLPGSERENVWNSDRRFGDVYANNLEQNRDILGFDDAQHPYARFGGQLVGGLVAPGASVEGVGFSAARNILRAGGTRAAAEAAARRAVVGRLATSGAAEGGVAGAGAGESWQDRAQGAMVGAPAGGVLGSLTGAVAPRLARIVGKPFSKLAGREGEANAQALTDGALDAGKAGGQNAAQAARAAPDHVSSPSGTADAHAFEPWGKHTVQFREGGPVEAWTYERNPYGLLYRTREGEGAAPVREVLVERPNGDQLWLRAEQAGNTSSKPVNLTNAEAESLIRGEVPGTRALDAGKAGAQNAAQLPAAPSRAADAVAEPVAAPEPPAGRPGVLTGREYVERFAQPYSVKDYIDQPPADRLGSAVIGPDGKLHAFRTNGSESGHADEVGHYDFLHAVGPDEDAAYGSVTRYRGEIAVTRPSNPTPQQEAAFNQLAARAKREGLAIVDENPKPAIGDADRAEFADYQREWDARQPMRAEPDPTIYGPDLTEPRTPDRIDVNARPRPVTAERTEAQRAAQAAGVQPRDVLPLPANTVDGIAEAERIGAGRYETVRAPNERDTLEARAIPSPVDGTRTIPKRGPLDLVTWLRTQGGIKPMGGTLEYMGIDNASRNLDFARGENRFGKLVSEDGLGIDVAAHDAWEKGFFPDHAEPPTISEFLDALEQTHTGRNRVFHPDDFEEVDRFEAARTQRYDVEKAQLDGAPLVNDRGEPVDMADLDRNSAPIHAYEEWGENAPNLAGNIRLDKLDSPQAIKRALAVTDQRVGGFDAATRGRITHAETEALASDLGMTADDLLKRRKGEAFNAEQALAARQILARSGTDLVNLAKRIERTDNPGDELEAAFSQAWLRHVAIQEQVSGMTAEAGRALSQFRMAADARAAGRVLPSLSSFTGGPGKIKEVADKIVELEKAGKDARGIDQFIAKALKPSLWSKLTELRMNFLLSGPQTHAVNILSNTLTALGQIPEHAIAAGLGGTRQALSKAPVDRVLGSEVGARAVGLLQGFREGMENAKVALRTGESAHATSKVEVKRQNAISGRKGELIRIPSRLLTAEDELFKGIAQRMELNGLATRQARMEGLRGQKAVERIAALVTNPPDHMLAKSIDYGRYLTYNQALPHNSLTSAIARAANADNIGGFAVKLIFPFQRTPVNILRFAAERSPIAPILAPWRADIKAGGARRDLAMAKVLAGSGMMATTMVWAANGHFTGGGPADPEAKRLMQADGWQPYSIRVGDRYYSYSRLDPLATTLGVAADFAELQSHMTEKQRAKVAVLLATATAKNLGNKVWFSGASDLVEAINDPDRKWDSYARRMGASMVVPTVSAQIAKSIDPNLHEARSMLDAIKARVPGLSKYVPVRRDVWGEPVKAGGSVGPDFASPIWTSLAKNDRTIKALLDAEIHIGKPNRRIGGRNGRDLSEDEFGRYQEAIGRFGKPMVDALVRSPDWKTYTPTEKRDAVSGAMKDSRAQAKAELGLGAAPE